MFCADARGKNNRLQIRINLAIVGVLTTFTAPSLSKIILKIRSERAAASRSRKWQIVFC